MRGVGELVVDDPLDGMPRVEDRDRVSLEREDDARPVEPWLTVRRHFGLTAGVNYAPARHRLSHLRLSPLATLMVRPADVVRPRSLRSLVVVLMIVVVRTMMRMRGRVHVAVAHMHVGRVGPVLIVQHYRVVRHVLALVVRDVRSRQRADTEVAARHRTAALAHALPLPDCAIFPANLVTRGVARVLRHVVSPAGMVASGTPLDVQRDGDGLLLRLPGLSLAPDVLGYCLTRS